MGIGLRLGTPALFLLLAACSSIPLGTSDRPRPLDALNDDIASLLIAFDLPPSLEPAPEGSTLTFDVTVPASGTRHIEARLVPADPGELAGALPPPSGERNYYLFGFSDADKATIRQAQGVARQAIGGAVNHDVLASTSLNPRFCRTGPLDPASTTVSALVALPAAPRLMPLISNMPLSTVLATAGIKDLPACPGHSG